MLRKRLMFPPRPLVLFKAAIVRAVWSSKMPLANAPAVLGSDPAFYIVWSRFRMMRRYLAICLDEEPRIFRMLDLISGCSGSWFRSSSPYLCRSVGFCLGWGGARDGFGSPSLR